MDGALVDGIKVVGATALRWCTGFSDPVPELGQEIVDGDIRHLSYQNDEALVKRGRMHGSGKITLGHFCLPSRGIT